MAGVDVHHRERQLLGGEGLDGDVQEHGRVLATGEKEDWTLALGHHFANDEHRVGFEQVQMVDLGVS